MTLALIIAESINSNRLKSRSSGVWAPAPVRNCALGKGDDVVGVALKTGYACRRFYPRTLA